MRSSRRPSTTCRGTCDRRARAETAESEALLESNRSINGLIGKTTGLRARLAAIEAAIRTRVRLVVLSPSDRGYQDWADKSLLLDLLDEARHHPTPKKEEPPCPA